MRNLIENDEVIKLIKPYLKDVEAYIVGGFVRDILMNKKSPDRDLILCNCDVEKFSQKLWTILSFCAKIELSAKSV